MVPWEDLGTYETKRTNLWLILTSWIFKVTTVEPLLSSQQLNVCLYYMQVASNLSPTDGFSIVSNSIKRPTLLRGNSQFSWVQLHFNAHSQQDTLLKNKSISDPCIEHQHKDKGTKALIPFMNSWWHSLYNVSLLISPES